MSAIGKSLDLNNFLKYSKNISNNAMPPHPCCELIGYESNVTACIKR